MPNPIPAVIDYRVEEISHVPTLKMWGLKSTSSRMFLCRVTRQGNEIVDSIPVAIFDRDSEASRFAVEFLKQGSTVISF